jgi:hypothetical protein
VNARRYSPLGLTLGALFLLLAPGVAAQAPPATPADTFAELHARLERAAELELQRIRGESAPTSQGRPELPLPTQSLRGSNLEIVELPDDSYPSPFAPGRGRPSVAQANMRLRALGVDAVRTFAEEGVPPELLAVAGVESAFNPSALSPKGALGLWQLMPETAVRFGLRVGTGSDDRLAPALSTRAAARYLRSLYRRFGNWPLALAAYNAGESRVSRAIERAGTQSFAVLAARGLLPKETRLYVPTVMAGRRGGPK